MAKDYAAISKKIVENIGGVENIASVTHCMTRLRFVVKDEGKINAWEASVFPCAQACRSRSRSR